MLIEFSVANYRSFAEPQSLSLVASNLKDKNRGRVVEINHPQKLNVLTSAMILGKNGSGKSTLVDAMEFVRSFVKDSSSSSQEGEEIMVTPHLRDVSMRGKDTEFHIIFSVSEKIYQFSFSLNKDHISKESLLVSDRTSRFRKIYERTLLDEGKYDYSFSEDLKGEKNTWKSSTRKNALFLSTAVQLNADQLQEPFKWLSKFMRQIDATSNAYTSYTARECLNENNKKKIINFLNRIDIDLEDIYVEEEDLDEESLKSTFSVEFIKSLKSLPKKSVKAKFVHKNSEGDLVNFDLHEESTGTNALFSLAGPLFDSLLNGYCLTIDEINTSIHPLVLQILVEAFSDENINTNNAQLIFTSHDTSLLRDSFFRRDQIWFVEKDRIGRSKLVPLSDYSPRKGEALEKGYLDGRYGGVPAVAPPIEGCPEEGLTS